MNYSIAYPYQLPKMIHPNSMGSLPLTFVPPSLNPLIGVNRASLTFTIFPVSSGPNFNPLPYHPSPDFGFIQQQHLETVLKAKQQILINQIQHTQLLEQTSKELTKKVPKRALEDNLQMLSSNEDLPQVNEETSSYLTEDKALQILSKTLEVQKLKNKTIRNQIKDLVRFFIKNFGKLENKLIFLQREKYTNNQFLLQIFDALSSKYTSSTKCREDMTRFVLRKAVSYLRNCEREQRGLSCKAASLAFCKKYFEIKSEVAQNIKMESEEELLNFLLPYKKFSRNRTANNCFMTEIFSSEAFRVDYDGFLNKFDEILQQENKIKLTKFVDYIMKCIKEDKIDCILRFKRLPWLESWLKITKLIAEELRNSNTPKEADIASKFEMKMKKGKERKDI